MSTSWRSTPGERRRSFVGSGKLTLGSLALILVTNALISLFISIVVVLLLGRPAQSIPAGAPTSVAAIAPTNTLTARAQAGTSPTQALPERVDFYVVSPGDNLSAIASRFGVTMDELMGANGIKNPDWIAVGQKLAIPRPGAPTPTQTVAPIPTVTETPLPFDPPTPVSGTRTPGGTVAPTTGVPTVSALELSFVIDRIIAAGSLQSEAVEITKRGRSTDLLNWTLSDSQGHDYVFPGVLLMASDVTLRVHSAQGKDSALDLYWNQKEPIWADDGDVATLRDAGGQVVATLRAGRADQ